MFPLKKICSKCKKEKRIEDEFYKDRSLKSGYRGRCKQCCKEYMQRPEIKKQYDEYHKKHNAKPETIKYKREYSRKYYAIPENRAKLRKAEIRHNLKRWYGITLEEKRQMWRDQKGICKVTNCNKKLDSANESCVDHNHKTGKVRGLICRNCNFIIGHAHEDIKILEGIIEYLKKYDK